MILITTVAMDRRMNNNRKCLHTIWYKHRCVFSLKIKFLILKRENLQHSTESQEPILE